MADVTIKQGDTSPDLETTLLDSAGAAVNLTGATVRFLMTQRGTSTPKVDAAATVTDAAAGEVTYSWQATDTDTYGRFKGEIEVEFSDGSTQTFPNSGYIDILVLNDLG